MIRGFPSVNASLEKKRTETAVRRLLQTFNTRRPLGSVSASLNVDDIRTRSGGGTGDGPPARFRNVLKKGRRGRRLDHERCFRRGLAASPSQPNGTDRFEFRRVGTVEAIHVRYL